MEFLKSYLKASKALLETPDLTPDLTKFVSTMLGSDQKLESALERILSSGILSIDLV